MCSGSGFLLIVNFVSFVSVFCLIFHASIGLSINCSLSWYARDACFSHMYTESLKKSFYEVWRSFSGVGYGDVVPYIIGYYLKTYHQTLYLFFFLFWLN